MKIMCVSDKNLAWQQASEMRLKIIMEQSPMNKGTSPLVAQLRRYIEKIKDHAYIRDNTVVNYMTVLL